MSDLVSATVAARFSLLAEPSPGLLPRVMQPFAKRDLVPDHFASHREGGTLRLSFGMKAMPAEMVHLVRGDLARLVGVLELQVEQGEMERGPAVLAVAA